MSTWLPWLWQVHLGSGTRLMRQEVGAKGPRDGAECAKNGKPTSDSCLLRIGVKWCKGKERHVAIFSIIQFIIVHLYFSIFWARGFCRTKPSNFRENMKHLEAEKNMWRQAFWVVSNGDFHKWGYPQMDGLSWKIALKWMILGYPYFRKPLNIFYFLSRLGRIHWIFLMSEHGLETTASWHRTARPS